VTPRKWFAGPTTPSAAHPVMPLFTGLPALAGLFGGWVTGSVRAVVATVAVPTGCRGRAADDES